MNVAADLSIPIAKYGTSHPITEAIEIFTSILERNGFEFFSAPEVDTEDYNFTMLNIPQYHPARSMHDTIYLENGKLLRTHTSNMYGRLKDFPCRIFSIGKVYRSDNDSTHLPMFHQLEVLVVENDLSIENMYWIIETIINEFFLMKCQIRLRSSYFPFTCPSFEVDIMYKNNWVEVMGCGFIHKNVIPHHGLAFGFGIERMVMIKNDISDIRNLYKQDQRFFGEYK